MPDPEATIDDSVEEAAPAAPAPGAEKGIFESLGQSLEDLVGAVKAVPGVVKEAAYYTYYTAKAALGLAAGLAMGGLPTLVFAGGMAVGTGISMWRSKEKFTFKDVYKKISNDLAIGGILGGLAHYYFAGSEHISNVVKAACGTPASLATRLGCSLAYVPVVLTQHEYLNRTLIKDYEPEPLSNMWAKLRGPMKWVMPAILANFMVVPYYFTGNARATAQLSIAGANSALYGVIKEEVKKEKPAETKKTIPFPQQQYAQSKAA